MSNIEEDRYRSIPKDFLDDSNNSHKRKSLKEQDEYEVVKQFIDLNDNKKNMLHNYRANLFLNANISASPTNHTDNYYKSPLKVGEKKNNVRNTTIPQNKIPIMHYQMHIEGLDNTVESPITDHQRRQLTLIRKKTPSCPRPQNIEYEQKNMFRRENKTEANRCTSHDVHKNEYKNTNAEINITLKNSRNDTNPTIPGEKQNNDVQITPRTGFRAPIPSDTYAMKFNADKSIHLKYTDSPKSMYTEYLGKVQPRINYALEKQNNQNINYEKESPYMNLQKPNPVKSTHSSHMIRNISNPNKVYHLNNKVEIVRNRSTPDSSKNVTTVLNLSNLENAYDVYHTNKLSNVIIVKNVIQISNPNKMEEEQEEVRRMNESNPSSLNRSLNSLDELKGTQNKNSARNVSSPSNCNSQIDCRSNVSEYTNSNHLHLKRKEHSHNSSHTTAGLKRMSSSVDAIKYKFKNSEIAHSNLRSRYNSGETHEILIRNREPENTKRESTKDVDEMRLDSSRRGSKEEIKIKEIIKTDRMLDTYKEHLVHIEKKNKTEFSKEKGEKKEVTRYDESYRGREINTNNEKIKDESSSYTNSDLSTSYCMRKNIYNIDEKPIVVKKQSENFGYPMGNPNDLEQFGKGENKNKRASYKLLYGRNKVESFVDINGKIIHMFPDEKKLRASVDSAAMGEDEEYIEYTQIEEERDQINRRNMIAETRKIKEIEKIEQELKTERRDHKDEIGYPADISEINIDYNSEVENLENILKTVEKENKMKNVQAPKKRVINISDHDKNKNMKEAYNEQHDVMDTRGINYESSKWKETSNNSISNNPNKNIHPRETTAAKGNHNMVNESTNGYTNHKNDDRMNNSLNHSSGAPHGIRKIVPIPSKHKADKVNYINYHELSDFPYAVTAEYRNVLVNDLIEKSKDQEWTKQIEYMIDLRKVLKYYSKPFFEEHSKDLRKIVRVLVEFLNSPRSCVSKNSLLCLTEFYSVGMKKTDCTIEDVILPCLKKAHQTSVDFINSAANNTLLSICSACTESKLIQQFVKIMTSKTKTFNLLCLRYLISVLLKYDENLIKYKEVNKVVEAIFESTNGGSAEIKCTARVALVVLENICPIKKLCGKQISPEMLRKIEVLMNKTTDEDINTVLGKITVH